MRAFIKTLSLMTLFSSVVYAGDFVSLEYQSISERSACQAKAIALDASGELVSVYAHGVDPHLAKTQIDGKTVMLELVANDPVSRLAVLRYPKGTNKTLKFAHGSSGLNLESGADLTVAGKPARFAGYVRIMDAQVLPLTILSIHYSESVPAPGEPIFDASGEVVALALEGYNQNIKVGYAMPIEVYHRLTKERQETGKSQRCWLGVILNSGSTLPSVVSVRPDSPAAKAGLKRDDVLLEIGKYATRDYYEAVNAFYYLRVGQKAKVKVLRGTELIELEVLPDAVPQHLPEPLEN